MNLIDTHAHLYLPEFKDDINEVIEHALTNDISKILLPNIDSSSIKKMNELVLQFPEICYQMIGLHPTSVKENFEEEINTIESEITSNNKKYIAVGEIGIDLYWDNSYFSEQIKVFKKQLILADKYNLPVAIHTRNSFNETMDVLDEMKDLNIKGVFHCFSGNVEEAEKIVKKGFFLGIGGVVTFKNSNLSVALKSIKPEHLVLETDAPFLAPMPYRGKRNESAYIHNIATRLAEIYDVSIERIAEITTNNASQLFGFKNE